MIRYIVAAAIFTTIGASGASVDWQSVSNYVVTEWNAPDPVDVADFFYYRQCNNCHNLWHDGDRDCCEECGGVQFAKGIRARKIEHQGNWWRGYQTADGLLYIHKEHVWWFDDQFVVGNDVYQKTEAIIARDASLR